MNLNPNEIKKAEIANGLDLIFTINDNGKVTDEFGNECDLVLPSLTTNIWKHFNFEIMSEEKKYPEKLIFQGTIDGVKNPVFKLIPQKPHRIVYQFENVITKDNIRFWHFYDWQIDLIRDKFKEPEPQLKMHTVNISINGKPSYDFKHIPEGSKIEITKPGGAKATTILFHGDGIDVWKEEK